MKKTITIKKEIEVCDKCEVLLTDRFLVKELVICYQCWKKMNKEE